jgi:large subunit ribosomal protein L14e
MGEGTLADGSLQALVDAPGITRSVINYKRLLLTDLTVDISKSPDKETLKAALAAGDIEGKWAASSWGKKLARQDAKKKASDFDRFKAAKAKTARSKLIAAKLS